MLNEKRKLVNATNILHQGDMNSCFVFFKSKLSGTFMKKKTNDVLLNTDGKNLANRFITAQKKTWWMGVVLLGYGLLGTWVGRTVSLREKYLECGFLLGCDANDRFLNTHTNDRYTKFLKKNKSSLISYLDW
jgi:hypothetical protein